MLVESIAGLMWELIYKSINKFILELSLKIPDGALRLE